MKHHKRNIAFYLILGVLIWTGCPNMLDPPNPEVKGLKITISGDAVGARTLYPNTGFTKYVLSFDGPSAHEDVTIEDGAVSVTIDDLVMGDWTITATGYVKIGRSEYPAAQGSAQITIDSSSFQDLNIRISAQQEPGVNGFFSYSITWPSARANSGSIELRPFNNNELSPPSLPSLYTSPATGTVSLAPGFYVMTIRLYDGYRDVIRAEIVHIYSNMETEAEYVFTNGDFNEIFTLSGTLDVRVNGDSLASFSDSASAYIYAQLNPYGNQIGNVWINLNDNTWSMTLPAFDDDVTLSFGTYAYVEGSSFSKNIDTTVTVNKQDKSVDLGAIDIKAIYLRGTINVTYDGKPLSRVEINSRERSGSTTLTSPGANAPWSILVQAFDDPTAITFGVRGYQSIQYDDYGYSIEEPIFYRWVENGETAYEDDIPNITINLGNFPLAFDPANPPADPKPLAKNVWVNDGEITEDYAVDWYSIEVIEGTTYNLWWDEYRGNISGNYKTIIVDVYAWYSDGTPIRLPNYYSDWSYSSFTARSNDKVYIRVRSISGYDGTGTYGIVYSTDDTRPDIGEFAGGLAQRLQWIKDNNTEDGVKYTLEVTDDEIIAPQSLSYGYYRRTITIIIKGDEPERKISLKSEGAMFTVDTNVTLILENITLEGLNNNTEALVKVGSYGNLEMNEGATIKGNDASYGGGVYVEGGTFTMSGGEISGNTAQSYGGGVYLAGGTFTMNGGAISGNTASSGGGVDVFNNGNFTMNGGEISGNTASESGFYGGGGVQVHSDGTFTMNDGKISGNTADRGGGVFISYGKFTKTGGTIYGYEDSNNKNTANSGYAVYAYVYDGAKRKETTAGPTVNLEFDYNNGSPQWDGVWDDGNSEIIPGANLAAKLSWLRNNARTGKYVVEVTAANESIAHQELSYGDNTVEITIKGNNPAWTISLNSDSNDSMFTVGSGVTLILESITLIGIGLDNNTAPLVYVPAGGNLEMNDGAAITGNKGYIDGAGVQVAGGTFTMNGGKIFGNSATSSGGGVFINSGTFTMKGGEISDNTATNNGSGVYVINGGTFTMSSGKIFGNEGGPGGGVFINNGTFTMSGGEILDNTSDSPGGGVFINNGTFTMSNGEISGNTATGSGGGVYVSQGTFDMENGVISRNTSNAPGGGVYVEDGKFTKTGGTITGYGDDNGNVVEDYPTNDYGHAVYAAGSGVTKHRENTVGPEVNLSFDYNGGSPIVTGDWDD